MGKKQGRSPEKARRDALAGPLFFMTSQLAEQAGKALASWVGKFPMANEDIGV